MVNFSAHSASSAVISFPVDTLALNPSYQAFPVFTAASRRQEGGYEEESPAAVQALIRFSLAGRLEAAASSLPARRTRRTAPFHKPAPIMCVYSLRILAILASALTTDSA